MRDRLALLLDDGLVRRGRAARQRAGRRPARRRRGHRHRPHRRPPGLRDGQRPDGEGRARGARAPSRRSCGSPRPRCSSSCRSCTSSTPPARASPTRSSCSPAGAARAGSSPTRCASRAGCRRCAACSARRPRAVRTSPRSATSCSWSRATPRCTSARRGWPQEVIGEQVTLEEMGGARMHATVSGCGDNLVATTTRPDRRGEALAVVPAHVVAASRPAGARRGRAGRDAPSRSPTTVPVEERRAYDMRKVIDALVDDGLVLRDQAAVRQGARHRLRPARRPGRRHRRQQPDAPRRRAVRRQRRQGGAVHLALRRVQRAAALPRRRARLHDRHAGRAGGDHPPRRQDDHRGRGGDGAEDQRDRAQGVRRRAVRDVRARVRPRRVPRAAERVRSR